MSVITSSEFISSCHGGTDWRETSKKVLEELQSVMGEEHQFNLGFLYISDHLAKDTTSIFNLFRNILGIENWTGAIGMGVCGSDKLRVDQPAIAAMVGCFETDEFYMFGRASKKFQSWLDNHESMLVLTHAHPGPDHHLQNALKKLQRETKGFLIGGVSLCRPFLAPDAKTIEESGDADYMGLNFKGGLDGTIFSTHIPVATTLSQGCIPIGAKHKVIRYKENIILEFEDGLPQDVFEKDLREMALRKIGQDPNDIIIENESTIPAEFQDIFRGEILAGFPLHTSDTGEILARDILGMDEDGSMMVSHNIHDGDEVVFVHRDDETMKADFAAKLVELRTRIEHDTGSFHPKGGIFVSCAARAFTESGKHNDSEIHLIREILGTFPLCGFYSGGEIKGSQIYGYTGILTVFL